MPPKKKFEIPISFSDYFGVNPESLDNYGAFNLSLVADLPLFIDPFLLFYSDKEEYQALHKSIVRYVSFLRENADAAEQDAGLLKHWYYFPEIKQNWFGYSKVGNGGHGLGKEFAKRLNFNFKGILKDFGADPSKAEHIEKVCLFKEGVGRDSISDFVTNLLVGYLAKYTESYAMSHVGSKKLGKFTIPKADFDYEAQVWRHRNYTLPVLGGDFVLLTPADMLTKDETWINFPALRQRFTHIVDCFDNEQLRSKINQFLARSMPANPKAEEVTAGYQKTLAAFPEIADKFADEQAQNGAHAVEASFNKIDEASKLYIECAEALAAKVNESSAFYEIEPTSLTAVRKRLEFLRHVIENQDGYRIFYIKGRAIKREADLQILFKLTWFASPFDANAEVNNGRGPVDFKVSFGSANASLVEFKLASNKSLRRNLKNQVAIYEKANNVATSIKAILYFTAGELQTTRAILTDLGLSNSSAIFLIDARNDNKISASKAG